MSKPIAVVVGVGNDRYKGIQWTGVDDVVRRAFREAETNK